MAVGGDEDDWSDFEDDQAENPRPEERVKATEEKRSSLKRRTNKRRHDRDDHGTNAGNQEDDVMAS